MSMKIKKLSLKLDHKLSVGNIVWAKLGSHNWWPAIIIRSSDCGYPEAKFGNSWVFWFGDHKISEISRKRIVGFVPNFLQIFRDASGKKWKAAVYEALEIVAARCNHFFRNAKDLMSWAIKEFKAYDETLIGSSNLPPLVLKCLKDVQKFNLDSLSYSYDSNTDDISIKKEPVYVTVWCQECDFMPITGVMDEQLKALLEGINALENIIGNVEKRQEELRNVLEKKIEQVEERYERVAGNFSLISQRVEDFEKKLLACGNATNESKFVPAAPVSVPALPVSGKLYTYDGKTNWEVYKIQFGIISEANR
ncbi:DNA-methyltransferase 3B [Trichonephila clavipes]|nr:DNA-methyltransferase 3B [Trichonephila clavipes]